MFCTKCGTQVPPGARFCAGCGSPIAPPAAPTLPASAQVLASIPAAAPVLKAPASCLVYLFGDRFVPRDTALTAGEKLPCSEIKVQQKPLSEMMFTAAFVWLAQEGRISFSSAQKGALMFKRNALVVSLTRRDPQSPGGLEALVLGAITGNQKGDFVEDIVARVIGVSSVNPWVDATDLARRALVPLGCFTEQQKTVLKILKTIERQPVCDRIAALQPQLPPVQALLQSWQSSNASLYKQLYDDVKRGIQSRYEKPDTDSDSFGSD